jgi:Terpene synthase family 2, C-terminal metal binding
MEPVALVGPVIATDTGPPRSNSAFQTSNTGKRNLQLNNPRSEASMTSCEQKLSVPPIYSPFPAAIHPRHDRIQARSVEWSQRWCIGSAELRAKLVQHDIGTFAARVLPGGDEEVAQILVIIGWDNDIFSFHKESRSSSFYLNAVSIVQARTGAPLAEALEQVVAQRDRTMCHFLRVRDRCTVDLTLRQHKYLKNLESFIRGNQDWAISSARYLNPADPANLPSGFTSDPIDDKAEPLGLPTLDCWWQR